MSKTKTKDGTKTKDDFEFLVFFLSPPQFWDHKHGAAHIVYYCAGARTQGFLHVRQALYQLSYVCSHSLKLFYSHLSRARIIGVYHDYIMGTTMTSKMYFHLF